LEPRDNFPGLPNFFRDKTWCDLSTDTVGTVRFQRLSLLGLAIVFSVGLAACSSDQSLTVPSSITSTPTPIDSGSGEVSGSNERLATTVPPVVKPAAGATSTTATSPTTTASSAVTGSTTTTAAKTPTSQPAVASSPTTTTTTTTIEEIITVEPSDRPLELETFEPSA
jgi:hypothetical protein